MPEHIEDDAAARALRDDITDADLELLSLVNRRIELVQRLREHKLERGYPLIDAAREDWLVARLREANPGPISDAGVQTLVEQIILLVRSEISDGANSSPARG